MVDYRDRHVVVTGGTGALGTAVVGALVGAGAICHVPWRDAGEAERFDYRQHKQVKLIGAIDLSDEAGVSRLYGEVPDFWVSIHIAGGFAMSPVAKTGKDGLRRLVDTMVSCFLCCSAAVNAMSRSRQGGRIVNVAARHALEWRSGAGMVAYTASKAAVAAVTVALSEEVPRRASSSMRWRLPSWIRPWIRRQTGPPCLKPTTPPGLKSIFLASPENKVTRAAIVPVYGRS